MSDGLLKISAAEMGRRIGAGALDARDLTEAHLDAIAASPHRARIYARITQDAARGEAAAAAERAKRGLRRGPLDGVPISWKDLFDTAGVGTEAGSRLLAGRVPDSDAAVVARGRRGGLVSLGKTHMSELAFSGLGQNPMTATPPHRTDPDAVPGGSSSGAAASVAFGLAAAGIGSDTGGSVRVPSAWNDLVGFKTTAGWLPMEGCVPLCRRFDTIGPLCRSVEDATLLTFLMADAPAPDLTGATLAGMRFLVSEGAAMEAVDDGPGRAFEDALARLSAAGATIERAATPETAEALALSGDLFAPEAYAEWGEAIEANPEAMFHQIRARFRLGRDVTAPRHIAAVYRMEALRAAWGERTAGYDAVLVPTAPIEAPNAARLDSDEAYYVDANLRALRNTRIGNLLGLSGVSLPTDRAGCGLMLYGAPFGEAALCRVAAAAETAARGG